jgi:potassium efflux system protein
MIPRLTAVLVAFVFLATATRSGADPAPPVPNDAPSPPAVSAATVAAPTPEPVAGSAPAPVSGPPTAPASAHSRDGWIAPEDVPGRADSLSLLLQAALADDTTPELLARLGQELDAAGAELSAASANARTVLHDRVSLMAIQDARQQVESAGRGLPEMQEELGEEAKRLATLLARLDAARQLWERTREHPETATAGDIIQRRVERSLDDIDRVTARTRDLRVRVLALDDRIVDHNTGIRETLQKLEEATRAQANHLVAPNREPLWNRELGTSLAAELPQVPLRMAEFRKSTEAYLRVDARPFLLQGTLALMLVILLRHLRGLMAKGGVSAGMSPLAVRLLSRPYAMALLIAFLPTPSLHPTAPRQVTQLIGLLALLPVARILMVASARTSVPLYAGLFVLLLIDRTAIALATLPTVTLLLFLGEILLGGSLAYVYRRRLRAEDGSPLLVHALTLGLYGLVLTLAAEVCGWSALASLVGRLVLVGGVTAMLVGAATLSVEALASFALASPLLRTSRFVNENQELVHRWSRTLVRLAGAAYWVRIVLNALGLRAVAQETAQAVLDTGVSVGALSLSVGGTLAFVTTLVVSMFLSRLIHELLEDEIFPRANLPRGVPNALLTLTRYAIWSIGFLLALAAAGVEMSQLSILLGGLGVGIGLGLQDVVKNFAAGITLLFERRVHVGDAVQIPDKNVFGRVLAIGMRASVVRNWNGTEVVMPNNDLVDGTVTNWTLTDAMHRIEVPVLVSGNTDPETVMKLLVSVAEEDPRLLRGPAPSVQFRGFSPGSLDFLLSAWTDEDYERAGAQTSDLTLAVHRALRAAGIGLPPGTSEPRHVPYPPAQGAKSPPSEGPP